MIRTFLRQLAPVIGLAVAAVVLYPAGSRLLAVPPDAREVLALVDRPPTPSGPAAIVVFQIIDCSDTRHGLAGWRDAMTSLALDGTAPLVAGVLVGPGSDDRARTREILDQAGLDFPVHRDSSGRVVGFVAALGYGETPVALLFDADGRLRRAGPPRSFLDPDGWMRVGAAAIDVERPMIDFHDPPSSDDPS